MATGSISLGYLQGTQAYLRLHTGGGQGRDVTDDQRHCSRCNGSGYELEEADLGEVLAYAVDRIAELEEENARLQSIAEEYRKRLDRIDQRLRGLDDAVNDIQGRDY